MLNLWSRRLIVGLHYVFMMIVVAIPVVGFFGQKPSGFIRVILLASLIFAAIQSWFTGGECVLTLAQRRIERRLDPDKKESCGFINEQLKPLGVYLSPNIIRFLTAVFYGLDLYFLILA